MNTGTRHRSPRQATRVGLSLFLVLALAGTGACGSAGSSAGPDDGRLRVVTTVAPITSIVAAIGGSTIRIHGVVPEGTNSHTFEPPPSAAEVLSRADLVFMNGLKLEEPTLQLAERNLKDGAEIVLLGDSVLKPDEWIFDFSFPESEGKPNPHLWTDPTLVLDYAAEIRDRLVEADAANGANYQSGFASFAAQVKALDGALRTATETVPAANRKLLTYHDAYAYFGREYGWEIVGAIQVSSFEDPSPKEVARLIDQIKRLGVPAIFGSEVFPSPVLAQIGREARVRYVDSLRDDDLPGAPGDDNHSWLGLMVFNYTTMVNALGGDPSAFESISVAPAVPDDARYPQ
ncbi:MAG: metal ABC transporter substrate-binding protein [Acidimicrobiales bacterium]